MNTEQLTTLEEEWLKKQRSPAKDRQALYKRIGVYAGWQSIFRSYVELAGTGDLEALKRALYLAWVECSQDPLTTGVKNLDEGLIERVLGIAAELARTGQLDVELRWMLSYYYIVDRSYLDRFEGFDALANVSIEQPFAYRRQCLESSFDRRGQMGEYWRSVQALLQRPRP